MTGTEIKAMAEKLHTDGDTIPEDVTIKAINQCLISDLGKDAKVISSTTISATQDVFTNLPTNLLEILEIEKDGKPYYGKKYSEFYDGMFDHRQGKIRFPQTGSYEVWYYQVPAVITAIGNTPAVHELFHYAMTYYVASQYKSDIGDNGKANDLMNKYFLYRNKAMEDLERTTPATKAPRRVKVSRWS